MNTLIGGLLFFFVITDLAVAQKQFLFVNFGFGMNAAPVFDATGNLVPGPGPYVADFFWSANTNASMDSLNPAGRNTPFVTNSPGAGYFFGGTVTLFTPSFDILGQVRVWDTTYGATYFEARDNGGEFGFSNLIPVTLVTGGGSPPYPLIGLQSFQLQRLPILGVSLTTSNTLLFFWSTNLTSYALQHNAGFQPSNWITFTNVATVIGEENKISLPRPEGTMFYRLVSQ